MTTEVQEILALATAPEGNPAPAPKALLIFAHPDDETLAVGARIGRFLHGHFIHVTDGAPHNKSDLRAHGFKSWKDYRDARARELAAMLSLAGLSQASRDCLSVPDRECSFKLAELTHRIAQRIRDIRPALILTHPYEGGHPDHDACAFAVHHACALLDEKPPIVEAAFYHSGPNFIETEMFLPAPAPVPEIVHALSPREESRKRERMNCFVTQRTTLSQFACEVERYRIAPDYDFTRPPHPGPALYDHFPWGMTSGRFCQLSAEAIRQLGQEASAA